MSQEQRKYCIVEHLWRALRALFILIGTALWLYTDVHAHFIFGSFLMAVVVEQFHGKICRTIEKLLNYPIQHSDWE